MAIKNSEAIKQLILETYQKRTKGSDRHNEHAQQFLPGGDTRAIAFHAPYPFFATKGEGCCLYDCDNNKYIDFVNNFTALIHGHAHSHVTKAIMTQAEKGTAHGVPTQMQYQLAELLCNRVPSMDSLRYCNSGTEATLYAMRAARAFTGKNGFLKMDGGYNGSHDFVEVNITPDMTAQDLPTPRVEKGVPTSVLNDIFIVPFNDLTAAESILSQNKDQIAAILMEPMLGAGGLILPAPGYLQGMRELADKYGILLIFDEIITLRLHLGGMQAMENVIPDLTTIGKIMGGGLPIGAFGGRKDIMDQFDPRCEDFVVHSGTFSGNAMVMTAGLAAMEIYNQAEIERINILGDRLREGLKHAFKGNGIQGSFTGRGSLVGFTFAATKPQNAKETVMGLFPYRELMQYLHLGMINKGINYISRGAFALSTPMTEKEIDQVTGAFDETLAFLKPLIVEAYPEILIN